MVSRDRFLYSLHADGVEFFSLTFPDPDQPLERSLNRSGTVELMSGNGYFWMRAYLFVADHPYYALTKADGSFEIPLVPAGANISIVAWHEGVGYVLSEGKNGRPIAVKDKEKTTLSFELTPAK